MSTDPYRPPTAAVADVGAEMGIEVTWGRAAKVWWSLLWRTLLFGGLAGMLIGAVFGGVMGAFGTPPQEIAGLTTLLGLAVGIPVGIWVVRNVLSKSWSDFRIVLVSPSR
jgi:hypothetical protein